MSKLYQLSALSLQNEKIPLSTFAGKVILIVNTASKCGFTPQYNSLEQLYKTYGPKGFVVLGFPCNQFGKQEPGDAEEIRNFCTLVYDVTFPMFAPVEVNGPRTDPVFAYLKAAKPGFLGMAAIKWNFTKFLMDRKGDVVSRHAPMQDPLTLSANIEALLAL